MMNRLQAVALGDEPADLVVRGGRVCLVQRGEFQQRAVAVVDNQIASLPRDPSTVIGDETTVINASERAVLPGLIDAHTHLDIHQTVENAYHYLLEGGTTTLVTEVSALGTAFGAAGVEALLSAAAYLPITIRATVPPQPLFDTFEDDWADETEQNALESLLDDPRVVGVGETDWIHIVGTDTRAESLYDAAHTADKPIAGHGAGCAGSNLSAFASVVDTDHEAISVDGVEERLEQGLHVIGRSGSIRDDAGTIAQAVTEIGAADCSLSTDGIWPRDLIDDRAMDAVVRRVIDAGVDPIDAIRMATINPAQTFGLSDRGAVAPGNVADLVLVDDVEAMNVTSVVSGGQLVVHNNEPQIAPRTHQYPAQFYDSIDVTPEQADLQIDPSLTTDGVVRAVAFDSGLLSTEATVEPHVGSDSLAPAPDRDVSKAVLWNRRPGGTGSFAGFLTGLGLENGAVATTVTWETPGLLSIGTNDEDLLSAARRLVETGGGWAVVQDGEVIAELPMRVGGVCSDLEVEETAKLYEAVEAATRSIGSHVDRPLLAIQTLTFPGVPALKFGFDGYRDVLDRSVVGVEID